jgi:hypothetical protein
MAQSGGSTVSKYHLHTQAKHKASRQPRGACSSSDATEAAARSTHNEPFQIGPDDPPTGCKLHIRRHGRASSIKSRCVINNNLAPYIDKQGISGAGHTQSHRWEAHTWINGLSMDTFCHSKYSGVHIQK